MEGEILLTLLASFAQAESASNSEAVKWAIQKKYQEGYGHSYRALGYRTLGRRLLTVPDEAEIVQRVFTSYLAGVSPEKVIKQLKNEGFTRTSPGLKLNPSKIRLILENPLYIGAVLSQKYRVPIAGASAQLNEGEEPQYLTEDHHEPIIDHDLFEKVQQESCAAGKPAT